MKYFHTLRHLKARQLFYQCYYRFRKVYRAYTSFKYSLALDCTGHPCQLTTFPSKPPSFFGKDKFIFLNLPATFSHWNDCRLGMLWAYNLNYMDYLLQRDLSMEEGKRWIEQFIAGIDKNRVGMDPYPIALRGINWIKFISVHHEEISDVDRKHWDSSLYAQYQILQDNLEYHLMGNHLLEDAFSLYFASFYFRDETMFHKASRLLREQLREQILPDGGHYELSPMYHCILLDRLLDCINITKGKPNSDLWKEVESQLVDTARQMCGWLAAMEYQNGDIPLLNDAAYSIAPETKELFQYAERLGIHWELSLLADSGYRKKHFGNTELVMDVGAIGPDYIPGHAHADTFSYELRLKGTPFIIDTGISTYNKNNRRQYERSTEAHNTVVVDDRNSSEVWGGFRVAQRARIVSCKETNHSVIASHNGYGIIHTRHFRWNESELEIRDELSRQCSAANYIILHPDVKIMETNQHSIKTNVGVIEFEGQNILSIDTVNVSFEYNQLISTNRIKAEFGKEMNYRITW